MVVVVYVVVYFTGALVLAASAERRPGQAPLASAATAGRVLPRQLLALPLLVPVAVAVVTTLLHRAVALRPLAVVLVASEELAQPEQSTPAAVVAVVATQALVARAALALS